MVPEERNSTWGLSERTSNESDTGACRDWPAALCSPPSTSTPTVVMSAGRSKKRRTLLSCTCTVYVATAGSVMSPFTSCVWETAAEKVRQMPFSGSPMVSDLSSLKGCFVPGMVAWSVSLRSMPAACPSIVTSNFVSSSFLATSFTVKRYSFGSSVRAMVTRGLSPPRCAFTIFPTASADGASLKRITPQTDTLSGASAVMSVAVSSAVKLRSRTRKENLKSSNFLSTFITRPRRKVAL